MLHPAARPLGLAMACSLLCSSLAAGAEESPHTGGEQRPLIIVESVKPQGGRAAVAAYGITDDDLAAIVQTLPTLQRAVPIRTRASQVRVAERVAEAQLFGTTDDYAVLHPPQLAEGRFLTADDVQHRRSVGVLGHRLAGLLFPAGTAVGQTVRAGRHAFLIVGVLAAESTSQQLDLILPLSTLRSRYGKQTVTRQAGGFEVERVELSRIELLVPRFDTMAATSAMLEKLLARRHDDRSFRIVTTLDGSEQLEQTERSPP